MKAVGLLRYLPITDDEALLDVELPTPDIGARDLLVAVQAVSVNPVDCKVRAPKPQLEAAPRVLGWDAAGIVKTVGSAVTLFRPGDRVYYAGSLSRPGCNAEWQAVDERIVGHMPATLDFARAAALPLTTITAWEALFDRLRIDPGGRDRDGVILIIGGAGGVGSIAIQLAKRLAGLKVIATASRAETRHWVETLGADHVVDHRGDVVAQVRALGFATVDAILCASDTDQHFAAMAELIRPQGAICAIVENRAPLPMGLLKNKSASFCWEFMFTRAMYDSADMIEQHRLLDHVANCIDRGQLRTTWCETLGPIDAAHLRRAHQRLESGQTIGKLVLEGF